jgi:hypothetical protein
MSGVEFEEDTTSDNLILQHNDPMKKKASLPIIGKNQKLAIGICVVCLVIITVLLLQTYRPGIFGVFRDPPLPQGSGTVPVGTPP